MARPKRAEINDVNRRKELIATAARLFKEKGFHATTTRDIAKASNMQAGSPFYHFASKQDLLFAGVESSLLDCLSALEAVDSASLPPLDYFRALTRSHLGRLLDTDSGVVPMVVGEWRHLEGEHREQVIAIRKRFELLWRRAFARLKEAGLVPRADTLAVGYFLSALHGVVSWYRPDGLMSPDEIADDLVSWVTAIPIPCDPVR
jgi:TetR/AcrR family transcriptional regulator, cholesterol catabolism regulator